MRNDASRYPEDWALVPFWAAQVQFWEKPWKTRSDFAVNLHIPVQNELLFAVVVRHEFI